MTENKRVIPGFIGGSYRDNNPRYSCEQTINYYLQADEVGSGKEKQVTELLQRPGLTLLQNIAPGPIRPGGMYLLSTNAGVIVVSGNQVYFLTGGMATPINIAGSLGTSAGYVSISDNGGYVFIADGTTTYYTFAIGDTTLQSLTNAGYPGGTQITYQDGFFLGCQPNSPNIFSTANTAPEGGGAGGGPIAWPSPGLGSNIAVKQGYADLVTALISNGRELFIWGTQTGEVWDDSLESSVFTFAREDGKNSQVGCLSPASLVQLAGTMFWLGSNPQGGPVVYSMNGYTPQRISTHAVELSLAQSGDLTDTIGMGMLYEGHYFYILQAPGLNTTWVFDLQAVTELSPQNGIWVEWQTQQTNNTQGQWLPVAHAVLNNVHLFGDTSGNIYSFDATNATDNGMTMLRRRRSPHISNNLNPIFYGLLQADFLMGQGLVNNGTNTSNNVNPQAILRCSDDGGQTYGTPIYTTLGAIGAYKARARWSQLGWAYDRVFEISVTDNVIAHLVVVAGDFEEGK
jgi:hypothetical protein